MKFPRKLLALKNSEKKSKIDLLIIMTCWFVTCNWNDLDKNWSSFKNTRVLLLHSTRNIQKIYHTWQWFKLVKSLDLYSMQQLRNLYPVMKNFFVTKYKSSATKTNKFSKNIWFFFLMLNKLIMFANIFFVIFIWL